MTNRDIPVTDALLAFLGDCDPGDGAIHAPSQDVIDQGYAALATLQASPPVGDDLVEENAKLRRLLTQAKHHVVFAIDVDANAGDLANEIAAALSTPKAKEVSDCDHYKLVSGGDGPWRCVKCGAVDPERPKYGKPALSPQPATRGVDVEAVARALALAIHEASPLLRGCLAKDLTHSELCYLVEAAIATIAPQLDVREALICGTNCSPIPADMVGCGKPIASLNALYRCTHCDVPFHKECADKHFQGDNVLTEEMVVEIERRSTLSNVQGSLK
jgi:hypothetical protein